MPASQCFGFAPRLNFNADPDPVEVKVLKNLFCLLMEGSGLRSVKIITVWTREAWFRNTAANLRNFLAAEIFGQGFGSALI
jgi:hypothetical protein